MTTLDEIIKATEDLSVAEKQQLVTALAWSDVLLTLDRADFVNLLGSACYGMPIMLPSELLTREREAGRI